MLLLLLCCEQRASIGIAVRKGRGRELLDMPCPCLRHSRIGHRSALGWHGIRVFVSPFSFFVPYSFATKTHLILSLSPTHLLHPLTTMAAPVYKPAPMNPRRTGFRSTTFPGPPMSMDESPIVNVGLGYIKRFRQEHLSSLRPFAEFIDTNRLSKPNSVAGMCIPSVSSLDISP